MKELPDEDGDSKSDTSGFKTENLEETKPKKKRKKTKAKKTKACNITTVSLLSCSSFLRLRILS